MLRARQKLGKYRILGRIASGPMADVYRAADTIHKTRVALKIPKADDNVSQNDFLREVQIATRLNHVNILPIQDASFIDGNFVIAMELGTESLADRIVRRMSVAHAMSIADQALAALAHAHEKKIIHCDIKPENFILFPGNRLKLADFGFAKISLRTLKASGSGTIDYIAPEQAMGRPKFQSDVFSLGLVLYRLFSGKLPEWPFKWPMVGHDRLQKRYPPELSSMLRKAIELDPADRFRNASEMAAVFRRIKRKCAEKKPAGKRRGVSVKGAGWHSLQWREFQRLYRKDLETRHFCRRCEGPVAENMQGCPWCGTDNPAKGSETSMPAICPRCERGVKTDWRYCAWCYGPGFEVETTRRFPDKRYTSKCANSRCRKPLMPFMRYCPWCKTKIKKPSKIAGHRQKCSSCHSGIVRDFWNFCPWCNASVNR
ncbi:MAG: protein kinase domain-containing protein [Woeseiaceae bacterium]